MAHRISTMSLPPNDAWLKGLQVGIAFHLAAWTLTSTRSMPGGNSSASVWPGAGSSTAARIGEELAGLEVAAQGQGDVAVRLGVAGDASAAGPDQRAFLAVLEVLSPQDAPFPQKLRFSWQMRSFALQRLQISSDCNLLHDRCRSLSCWYFAHAVPTSASSLTMVFLATPVMRTVLRMEQPSTKQVIAWARGSAGNLFIMTIIRERFGIAKHFLLAS